jgi:integrase/recombinase XerD
MNSDNSFYDVDKRVASAHRVLDGAAIVEPNRSLIRAYLSARHSEGIGPWQITKTLYHLLEIAKILERDFREAGHTDVARLVSALESCPYAAWTKSDYKLVVTRFYKWLRRTDDYPPEVRWIKARVIDAHRKLPEELLTRTEVDRMIQHAVFGRDRALILALFESGCRVGEIGQLRIRHLQFDLHGARLIVRGKTGMRRIRVVKAARLLRKWIDIHPLKDDPDSPLWIGLRGMNKHRILTRDAIARVLERAARRAGIKKRVHPHLFRH